MREPLIKHLHIDMGSLPESMTIMAAAAASMSKSMPRAAPRKCEELSLLAFKVRSKVLIVEFNTTPNHLSVLGLIPVRMRSALPGRRVHDSGAFGDNEADASTHGGAIGNPRSSYFGLGGKYLSVSDSHTGSGGAGGIAGNCAADGSGHCTASAAASLDPSLGASNQPAILASRPLVVGTTSGQRGNRGGDDFAMGGGVAPGSSDHDSGALGGNEVDAWGHGADRDGRLIGSNPPHRSALACRVLDSADISGSRVGNAASCSSNDFGRNRSIKPSNRPYDGFDGGSGHGCGEIAGGVRTSEAGSQWGNACGIQSGQCLGSR